MQRGWVKLWRKTVDSRIFKDPNLLKVWVWCLMKATHQGRWVDMVTGKGVVEVWIKPGQFIFGRESAALELSMKPSSVRNRIKKLKTLQNLDIEADRQYSIITIINWDTYQPPEEKEDSEEDNQRTAKGQPKDTDKNVKNNKNNKKTTTEGSSQNNSTPYQKIIKTWNDAVVQNNSTIPQVTTINPNTNRQAHVRARYKDHSDIEIWEKMADKATRSDFLNGRTKARSRPFSFDWAVKSADNFAKILEGAYDNTDRHGGGPQKEDGGSKYDKLKETVIYTDQK